MRLILDIDSNTQNEKSKDIFEAITNRFPNRLVSLNVIDETNENQFYDNEQPVIDSLKAHHDSIVVNESGTVIGTGADRDDTTMSYNQFLFAQLLQVHNEKFKTMPYDVLFEVSQKVYAIYEVSEHNDVEYSDYECFEDFIKNEYEICDKYGNENPNL
jgi:hypothetical protein